MPPGRKTILLTTGYALALAGIVVLADSGRLAPLLATAHGIPFFDKLGHLVLVGLLALAMNLSLGVDRALGARTFTVLGTPLYLGSAIVGAIALAEELSQRWVPSRSFDPGDLAADALGIALASALTRRLGSSPRCASGSSRPCSP